MRYLVTARLKSGCERGLLHAIESGALGQGSVAEVEYLRNVTDARLLDDGTLRWVEVCYCDAPLDEERPYWEQFFELVRVQDAHARFRCRDLIGEKPWACNDCSCTEKLEAKLQSKGVSFLKELQRVAHPQSQRAGE